MKKKILDSTLYNINIDANRNLITDKKKTTNINILLNRVKLDKKKDFKKKIIFLLLVGSVLGVISVFALI